MSAIPGAAGSAGRSTQHGCCGGPADVALKRASKTEDRPAWRETRCAIRRESSDGRL
jgi:hypothetical protein